jgi:hypothetical protein
VQLSGPVGETNYASDLSWDFWNRVSMTLSFTHSLTEVWADACPALRSQHTSGGDYRVLFRDLIVLGQPEQVATMKFLTAYPMALWLRNDLPKFPRWSVGELVEYYRDIYVNPETENIFAQASLLSYDCDTLIQEILSLEQYEDEFIWFTLWLNTKRREGFWNTTPRNFWARFPWLSGSTKKTVRGASIHRTTSSYAGKIFWSLLQGVKRGCNEVPEAFIGEAMEKHKAALSKELPTIPPAEIERFREKFSILWSGISNNTREFRCWNEESESIETFKIKRNQNWSEVDKELVRDVYVPGPGACVENVRSLGGRFGFMQYYAQARNACEREYDRLSLFKQWGVKDEKCHRAFADDFRTWAVQISPGTGDLLLRMVEDKPGQVHEVRGMITARWSQVLIDAVDSFTLYGRKLLGKVGKRYLERIIDDEPVPQRTNAGATYTKLLMHADQLDPLNPVMRPRSEGPRRLLAKVAPVLEPLKCRLITKGEGLSYQAAMPLQKALWKHLYGMEPFKLIGQTIDASHLAGILLREKDLGIEANDLEWVSGDYSAATDGLSQQINSTCLSAALDRVGATDLERAVWSRVLGNHHITYPEEYQETHNLAGFDQTNGQLMGSPLSFPVLCAINLVAYWLAFEEFHNRKIEDPSKLPVLVNGDDILFRANDQFYSIWKKWITLAGFELSLGKNYKARDVLTVNSACWIHSPSKERGEFTFTKIGCFNPSLLLPYKSGARPEMLEKPWVERVNFGLQDCNDPEYTHRRILHHWKEEVAHQTCNGYYSLVGDPRYGAVGLSTRGWTGYYTVMQKRMAYFSQCLLKEVDGTVQDLMKIGSLYAGKFCLKAVDVMKPLFNRSLGREARIVFRANTEPCREHEERIGGNNDVCAAPPLATWYSWKGMPTYKIAQWGKSLREKFSKWNRTVSGPLSFVDDLGYWDLEPRVQRIQSLPVNNYSGPVVDMRDYIELPDHQ